MKTGVWIKHDGSDTCPIDGDLECTVKSIYENFDLDKRDQTSTKVKWLIVATCVSILIYAVLFRCLYHA